MSFSARLILPRVLAAVLLFCGSSVAYPYTIALAAICKPEDFGAAEGRYNTYGIWNNSTTSILPVYCEIPRSNYWAVDYEVAATVVTVYDRSTTSELKVTRCMSYPTGNGGACSTKCSGNDLCTNPGYASTGPVTIALPGVNYSPDDKHRLHVYGEIPPSAPMGWSHITTIRFDETP